MNLRTGLAALTLTVGSLISMPAFAQGRPLAPAVVVQPAPVVAVQTSVRAVPPPSLVARPAPAPRRTPAQERAARQLQEQRRQTAEFSARVETQSAQLLAQIRTGIARGTIRPAALQQANALHTQLAASLRRTNRDGILSAQEQRQANNLLERMARLEAQFRIQVRPVSNHR